MKILIRKNKKGEFYYAMVSVNGETLNHSEGVKNLKDLEQHLDNLTKNIGKAQRVYEF